MEIGVLYKFEITMKIISKSLKNFDDETDENAALLW
jgi:hypothetical protein